MRGRCSVIIGNLKTKISKPFCAYSVSLVPLFFFLQLHGYPPPVPNSNFIKCSNGYRGNSSSHTQLLSTRKYLWSSIKRKANASSKIITEILIAAYLEVLLIFTFLYIWLWSSLYMLVITMKTLQQKYQTRNFLGNLQAVRPCKTQSCLHTSL